MRDRLVVEVVARIVQAGRVAIADEDKGAGTGEQHVGKILAAHHRIEIAKDLAFAGNILRCRKGVGGFLAVVDRDG